MKQIRLKLINVNKRNGASGLSILKRPSKYLDAELKEIFFDWSATKHMKCIPMYIAGYDGTKMVQIEICYLKNISSDICG